MLRRSVLIAVAVFFCLGVSSVSYAASQSTFSISPPPIATPVFDVKETDEKIGAMYLSMKSTDPGMDFKLDGYGLGSVTRKSFGNILAIDYSIGVAYMTGKITMPSSTGSSRTGLKGMNIPLGLNLEVQPYKNDSFNIIFFAGPAINLSIMQIDSSYVLLGKTYSMTIDSDSFLYGPQGGLQMGIKVGDFHIDLFGMVTSLQGTQSTSSSYGGSTSTTIPAYTSTSTGADLVYDPWGLALSSILQQAKQGDQNGFKTSIYQLSWSRKF